MAPETRARIRYLGKCNASEIADLRSSHTITIIASRYENLNYTMLEAMAQGAALVSTNVGGPAEVLQHEKTALLVPPNDPEAMAAACKRLLADNELALRLGSAAKDLIRNEFQPQTVGKQMVSFLEDIVGRHTGARGNTKT